MISRSDASDYQDDSSGGPLNGIRVLELGGIGAAPFCGMLLAGMGAEIIRLDRTTDADRPRGKHDVLLRGRRSIALDLKAAAGVELALRLVEEVDVVTEGFRPGVAERLGVGPQSCLARNDRLVYGRMTGWGQEGPLADRAGHDINYIAIAGALDPIGRAGDLPVPPLNLIGDLAGGGELLAFGIACALVERAQSGRGQVIDAAMVDGAALLMAGFFGLLAQQRWSPTRGTNLLDTGAHFYEVYECSDGRHVAVGAVEPKFYRGLMDAIGIDPEELPPQNDPDSWPQMKERLRAVFRTKARDEWCAVLDLVDCCVSPVLGLNEVASHPAHRARASFESIEGVLQPMPAPRLSRSGTRRPTAAPAVGAQTDEILGDLGLPPARIADLREQGVVA